MKRAILIAMTSLVALGAAPAARAETPKLTVVLAGGVEDSAITISLSPDGRSYLINSLAPLEVGGDVCRHPAEQPTELLCDAVAISGFEVNAGAGDDFVRVFHYVQVAVTLRGGPGNDRFIGGGGADKLVGGPGEDLLKGYAGDDALFGGPGGDRLLGGSGDDVLHGNGGDDTLRGSAGHNVEVQ